MRVPDFVIVGAGKAGTTSLHRYVDAHPQVFMPSKGVHYFVYDGSPIQLGARAAVEVPAKSWSEYLELFAGAGGVRAVGESSATYLDHPDAAERIRSRLPDVGIVVMLRDPVERTYSEYQMWVRNRNERRPPDQALGTDSPYFRSSLYHDKLRRYFDRFPRDRIWVGLYDDLRADSTALTQSIYGFVGVDDTFVPDTSASFNKGGLPRSRAVHNLLTGTTTRRVARKVLPRSLRSRDHIARLQNWNRTPAPALPQDVARRLRDRFRPDIVATGELIGRDLSMWSEPE